MLNHESAANLSSLRLQVVYSELSKSKSECNSLMLIYSKPATSNIAIMTTALKKRH